MSINAITGYSGIYDGKVQNVSMRYGMNAAYNMNAFVQSAPKRAVEIVEAPAIDKETDDEIFATALEKFAEGLEQDTFTPSKYRYQYSTVNEGEFDKLALLGAAYEEMGQKTETPVKKMTQMIQKFYPNVKKSGKEGKSVFNAKVLDTNKNGKVEVDEYGTFLALADIKSKDKDSEDISLMTGEITDEGTKEAMSYLAVNAKNPITRFRLTRYMRDVFSKLQDKLNLSEAKETFNQEVKDLNLIA